MVKLCGFTSTHAGMVVGTAILTDVNSTLMECCWFFGVVSIEDAEGDEPEGFTDVLGCWGARPEFTVVVAFLSLLGEHSLNWSELLVGCGSFGLFLDG